MNFDIGTGVSSILIILGLGSIDMQKSILVPKFLNYIGNASFTIYLSHNLVLYNFTDLFIELPLIKGLKRTIVMNINRIEKVSEKGII